MSRSSRLSAFAVATLACASLAWACSSSSSSVGETNDGGNLTQADGSAANDAHFSDGSSVDNTNDSGSPGSQDGGTSADASTAITIPLTVISRNSAGGLGLAATVNVGGANVVLLLDTGSTGIHVLTSDIPDASVARTGNDITEQYVDGTELIGEEANAAITLGSVTTAPIAIHLVDQVTCEKGEPDCSGDDGAAFFHAYGISGIMGVGISNAIATPSVFSPIEQLTGANAAGFVLHTTGIAGTTGTMTLGLPDDTTDAGFDMTTLGVDDPSTLPNGAPAWADYSVQVCYALDGTSITNECLKTIFDTGATATFFSASDVPNANIENGALSPGTVFHASIAGVFDWSFTVGATPRAGLDLVVTSPGSYNTNLGIGVFFAYDVLFDAKNGRIGVRTRN